MTISPAATLDIDALRIFLAVAELGGVTPAATRVGRTPAAVSMQLKKLEETLETPLFERHPRGMTATREGETLASYARRMLRLHGEALAAFREPGLSGEIRIGLIDDFCHTSLAKALRAFSETYPGVRLQVRMGATADLYRRLDQGGFDFAIIAPGCATEWRPDDAVLREDELVWVGLAGGCAIELDPLPVALSEDGCAWRKQAIDALAASGRAFEIAYCSDFYSALRAAVSADLAIAPMPRDMVGPEQRVLGAESGLGEIGRNRVALRWGPGPRQPAAEALAAHLSAAVRAIGFTQSAASSPSALADPGFRPYTNQNSGVANLGGPPEVAKAGR